MVSVLTVANLTTLYHVSTPRRAPWLRDVPGAVLTLLIWLIASFVVRGTIAASVGGVSIYGPLSAPIVLLIWLYALAIAVLIGAAFNAAIREMWPIEDDRGIRERATDWARGRRPSWRHDAGESADPFSPSSDEGDEELLVDLDELRAAARAPLTPVEDHRVH